MNERETPAENLASTRESQTESARDFAASQSGERVGTRGGIANFSDENLSAAANPTASGDAKTRDKNLPPARVLATSDAKSAKVRNTDSTLPTSKSARVLAAKPKAKDDEILPIHDWIYWTMTSLFRIFFRIGGWRVHGRSNVPRRGGVILAPNHVSLFDPPLVGCASPRRVTTMGKAELFEKKWFGMKIFPYIIQHMATFPVKRGAPDRRAIRRAQQVLKGGEALVIFPEGKRTRSGELGEGEIGLAMIAHSTKTPIVPIYLKGTNAALSPIAAKKGVRLFKTEVFFGTPLFFESEYSRKADRETLQAISNRVMQEIQTLKERAEKTK